MPSDHQLGFWWKWHARRVTLLLLEPSETFQLPVVTFERCPAHACWFVWKTTVYAQEYDGIVLTCSCSCGIAALLARALKDVMT